ncbi:MAG: XRE family transcriptional regulator [Treponema sp.]|jgi:putative transcriptional regulator|nr:XRE family transcriptional regulator [Treponema sp.]
MKYKSDAYEAIHEDAMAGFEVGAISEEKMKEYDEMCLVHESSPPPYKTEKPVAEHVTA